MSGGVDSSVTAGLLLEQGYEVAGVSLRLWEGEVQGPRSCSNLAGAETAAQIMGISHTLLDHRSDFCERVVKPFAHGYLQGRTPNPCIACNRDFKLGVLLDWAKARGADFVATGHYARIDRTSLIGRASLLRGRDRSKDQSYFLFALSQEQLGSTLFPLGSLGKEEVRAKARRLGLPAADRPESQDICLGDYAPLVESFDRAGATRDGDIVDRTGKVLGHHRGIHRLTVGQRRGLGISAPHPLYVLKMDGNKNRVIVGKREDLRCRGLRASSLHWIEPPEQKEIAAEVQVRYRSAPVSCWVRSSGPGGCEVLFEESFPAVTPGQAAVFYQGDRVLGGGWIEKGF